MKTRLSSWSGISSHRLEKLTSKIHASNSRKRCDVFVSASDGSLCAMAEMLLAFMLLGRRAEEDKSGSGAFNPVLSRAWELPDAVVTYFLAFVPAVQVAGDANRWPYRRLTALGTEAAKARAGTLGISARGIVV